ncbi:MAG TPA: circularly permuted type 2 ATP-grasp protein [Caulifigura sp.]|nr:circularly permuted type 2 ATP-grasp protein [Caulifigura sp.]
MLLSSQTLPEGKPSVADYTYPRPDCFDELFCQDGAPRPELAGIARKMVALSSGDLARKQAAAEAMLRTLGITFAVYGHSDGAEKVWPFDILPRIVAADEWRTVERGLRQRITALNLFLSDVYNEKRILRDKVIPAELVETAATYRPMCVGQRPQQGVWCHITGTDLVRNSDGQFYVLEDNLRCPSGVSYVLENREVMKRTLPHMFEGLSVVSVDDYPERLLDTLQSVAPRGIPDPTVVVLTPGIFNSAYFEHSFLAQQMGVELVEGSDLVIRDGYVHMRTTTGLKRVDVIYRRIDDDFLDPKCFRADSMLGVPGLMEVYRQGRVTLANAPGNGIADDKAVYAYVPRIIQYYLKEDPILPNVPTYVCSEPEGLKYVLEHLDELVVKPVNESGGYGILMGPQESKERRAEFAELVKANPRNYIAQPMLNLSTAPTIIEGQVEARHVDLRPFVLSSAHGVFVLPGGLTRVALKRGSLIVNSSQGGGSKDTWVLQGGKSAPRRTHGFSRTSLPVESIPC